MPWGLKRFQQARDLHYITFTCYRRKPRLRTAVARDVFEQMAGGASFLRVLAKGGAVNKVSSFKFPVSSGPTGQHPAIDSQASGNLQYAALRPIYNQAALKAQEGKTMLPSSILHPSQHSKPTISSQRMVLLALAVAALIAGAWASEPWRDKEYKSWTQDDVQRILYESPWVKMVEVSAPWLKGRTQYLTPLPMDCDGRPDMTRGDRTPTSWALGNNDSIVIFQVTWQSARTVRAAKLQQALLCGRGNAERGEEMLDEQPDNFIITVQSPDMTPFKGMDEDALIKATTLWPKKGQKKINPESVSIARYGNGGVPYMLTFRFPRKTDSGEPVIANDEKEVEFASQAGKFSLKTKFQLQKMTVKGGPDL